MLPNLEFMLAEAVALSAAGPAAHAPTMISRHGEHEPAKTVAARGPVPKAKPSIPEGPHAYSKHAAGLTKKAVHISQRMGQVAKSPKGEKGVAGHYAARHAHTKAMTAHDNAAAAHEKAAAAKAKAGEHFAAKMHGQYAAGHKSMAAKHDKYIQHHMDTYNKVNNKEIDKHMSKGANYGSAASRVKGSIARIDTPQPHKPAFSFEAADPEAVSASKKAIKGGPTDHALAAKANRKAAASAYKAGNHDLAHKHIRMAVMHKNASYGKKLRVAEGLGMKGVEDVLHFVTTCRQQESFDKVLRDLVESKTMEAEAPKIPADLMLKRRQAYLASHEAMKSNDERDHKHAAGLHSDLAQSFHNSGHHQLRNYHTDMAYNHVEAGMSARPTKAPKKPKAKVTAA